MPRPPLPALVLDASSPRIQVGVLGEAGWLALCQEEAGALEALFALLEEALKQAKLTVAELKACLYCQGPGSILGIRLCAMALRSWQALPNLPHLPCFSYVSLELAWEMIRPAIRPGQPCYVAAASRLNRWNLLPIQEDGPSDIREVSDAELAKLDGPVLHARQRTPKVLPLQMPEIDYTLERAADILLSGELLDPTDAPDARLPEEPAYKRWDGQAHSQQA